MIKITVCDDESKQLKQLESYLTQLSQELHTEFEIYYFSDGNELIRDMPRDTQILLLDIQMSEMSGLDAARQLREEGLDFWLFFITNNVEYALEGYEVHAYAFLRKPLIYSQFKKYMSDVFRKIESARPRMITLKCNDGMHILNCDDIYYFEVYGHDIKIVTNSGIMNSVTPLSELEDQLKKYGFFRCHKSYLVNLQQILHIGTRDVELPNGFRVPVSKYKKKDFVTTFSRLMGDSL